MAKASGKKRPAPKAPRPKSGKATSEYRYPDQTVLMRPDIGTQSQFRKKRPPQTYRYDSSLSPALDWDGQHGVRELGEWLIELIGKASALTAPHAFREPQEFKSGDGQVLVSVRSLAEAVDRLKRLGRPFLDWAGKAERLSFDVPTLPLFVHERLSTKAIVETLVGHRSDKQTDMYELFGDPHHSVTDQVLRAYEHQDKWANRMILGDSLVVMNSLLRYEGLGGQVQMIYIDPPYGVKFGSNFQPFVRKRDVSHNDDEDLTREPEMVKAYRDTWELGLHSYLTYMRDRLLLARDLLTPSGSVFVQISDENLHHVRESMDEVFGADNYCSTIAFQKTSGSTTSTVPTTCDYLLWYARDHERLKFRKLYVGQTPGEAGALEYKRVELADGSLAPVSQFTVDGKLQLPSDAKLFATDSIVSKGGDDPDIALEWEGRTYVLSCKPNRHWKVGVDGTRRLWQVGRLLRQVGVRTYKRYISDFPFREITHVWSDTRGEDDPTYVVQTSTLPIQRCLLMTTDPGDLVIDPTCGSGTTAYVAEQWGRRWITIDTSRVPLALARQRLLTATYPYYQLKESERGPASGFVYVRKQNKKGEEVGGIVPHVTLGSIANNEPPDEEVLVDRPASDNKIVRVTGPFAFEATIPTPVDWEGDGIEDSGTGSEEAYGSFIERMIEVLRRSPILHLGGGKKVELLNVRPPAKSLSLSAEALVAPTAEGRPPTVAEAEEGGKPVAFPGKPVAFIFGPENGAVSEKLVHEALKEASLKHYTHLYVIGFAIQPHARQLADNAAAMGLVSATYVQATPDLMMGDLLKNMRSSQIFSVCGLPDVALHGAPPEKKGGTARHEVELLGLDTFDPTTMKPDHRNGNDVPAWFLDTDYNGLCFHVSQAFFPRTGAWNDLKKALKGDYDDSVWDHLAGTKSAPFEAGEHKQIAVKVIDDRGNELLVVKALA